MTALAIVKPANSGACILEFEGATVRSDVLDMLQAIVGEPMSAPDLSRLRKRSAGSTANTLQRLTELHLAEATTKVAYWRGKFAQRQRTVIAFVATDKGKRLLAAAEQMKDQLTAYTDESDPEASWPRQDPADVVRQAMRTQPSSVFDLGRVCHVDDTPPVVAAPQRTAANNAFSMAAA